MNGSAAIHDFEIALAGHTSEDVEAVLPDGSFGSAEETGREMNAAIAAGRGTGLGMGEALGRRLAQIGDPRYAPRKPAAAGVPAGRFPSPYTWPWAPIRRTRIRRPTARPSAPPRITISACSARSWRN